MNKIISVDTLIVGCGCSGLYCAMNLPKDNKVLLITKSDAESSDSFLAQGGMCMLKDDSDYESYFEDTLKAGHYENDRNSVRIMIQSSKDVVRDLVNIGVDFARNPDGTFAYTREGAHSENRILFHEDITGKEITSRLLEHVRTLPNVEILENTTLLDIIENESGCVGGILALPDSTVCIVAAKNVVLATGGIGGLYMHSTNFRHLTGDALAIARKHNVELKNIDYVQIHPTTLYSDREEERSFLISESVRGEGAKLYNQNMERFTDELLPRDVLTGKIYEQMEKDHSAFVWEDLRTIPQSELVKHFPHIIEHCKQRGYDVTRECIPVVPAQHYFMGGIKVDYDSATSLPHLYAVGETACNGVHGKNRLASNSLLESLVFAKRAAGHISDTDSENKDNLASVQYFSDHTDLSEYKNRDVLKQSYQNIVKEEMKKRGGMLCMMK